MTLLWSRDIFSFEGRSWCLVRLPRYLWALGEVMVQLQALRYICLTDSPLLRAADESIPGVLETLVQNGVEVQTEKYGDT